MGNLLQCLACLERSKGNVGEHAPTAVILWLFYEDNPTAPARQNVTVPSCPDFVSNSSIFVDLISCLNIKILVSQ